jgi:hypothetical protein
VCGSALDQAHYEKALGIFQEKQQVLREAGIKAQAKVARLSKLLVESRRQLQKARVEGAALERARTQRILQGKDHQIQKLKAAMDHLKRGVTPQTEGLEFEDKLVVRLRREFPGDEVEHHGKRGDILHRVIFQQELAGSIVYELKRVERIEDDHIQQALQAKSYREADWAVLVHTGRKRGWTGFGQLNGVIVVSPLAVVPAVRLLRDHLLQMLRAKISQQQRAGIAAKLLAFVDSPQFKNPLEEVIRNATELQESIKDEAKTHFRIWKRRWRSYQAIQWDSQLVAQNVRLVMHGKKPVTASPFSPQPLALPGIGSRPIEDI